MAVPVWSVGQVLSASDVNNWFVPVTVIKPADTARNTTTSMSNDPDLVLNLAASATYEIRGVIFYDGPAAGSSDLKCTFTIPSGASGQYAVAHQNLSASYVSPFASNWTDTVTSNSNGTSTIMTYTVWGLLITTTAGAMHYQWAQNTSNATNTHIKAQSFLCAQRIG